MKILIAIANYGTKNDAYLSRVLSEYRRCPMRPILWCSATFQRTSAQTSKLLWDYRTRTLGLFHLDTRRIFAERKDAYDLFIYSEDDILITQRNIEAFVRVTNILPPQEVAGFFRWEQYPNGTKYFPDANGFYRWMPGSVKVIGDHTFARFTNDHSACYALTRSQLAQAIASGGFLVPAHEHRYDLLVTAATDPYTQCGFKKFICLSHFDEFLVSHLPNKYIGS